MGQSRDRVGATTSRRAVNQVACTLYRNSDFRKATGRIRTRSQRWHLAGDTSVSDISSRHTINQKGQSRLICSLLRAPRPRTIIGNTPTTRY